MSALSTDAPIDPVAPSSSTFIGQAARMLQPTELRKIRA
jgi:hypothetical protein